MAKIKVSEMLLCEFLLPGVQLACIRDIKRLPNGDIELDILGHEVPDVERVTAIIQYDWGRAVQTAKRTVTFHEV